MTYTQKPHHGRSAVAVVEIKDHIVDGNQKAELGTKLVNRSRDTLKEIVSAVTTVSDFVNGISSASGQPSISIENVSETISKMNQRTNNNSAMVDKLANAGSLLRSESDALSAMTTFF